MEQCHQKKDLVELYAKCMARKGVDLAVQAPISVSDSVSVPRNGDDDEIQCKVQNDKLKTAI
jgi:hypothetical protein